MTKEMLIKEIECPSCFINWDFEHAVDAPSKPRDPHCDYCKERPYMNINAYNQELLERRLQVIEKSRASRFPETIRLMYEVLKNMNAEQS